MDDIYNDMQKPKAYQKEIDRLALEVERLNEKTSDAFEYLVMGDVIGAKKVLDEPSVREKGWTDECPICKGVMLPERIEELQAEVERMRVALKEIRDVADCSEGVEFYSMLASKALGDGW